MARVRYISSMALATIVAIGCGGSKPQEASAKTESAAPRPLAESSAASAPAASGSATIRGSVKFAGSAPAAQKIKMDADPVCQQRHATPVTSEEVVVNGNGTLKNVFVYVKDGVSGTYPAPTTPAVLNQVDCWYQPHIVGIQVDQPFELVNNDSTLHNINAKPTINQPFNVAQPTKGMKTTKKFSKPEIMIKFKCNVHPWMSAYAGVVSHPFFGVSDETGAFTISGLPAGTYTLEAWHEKYGTTTQQVTVADGATASVDFTFAAH